MDTVTRVTGEVKAAAATTRSKLASASGPSLMVLGAVQVLAAWSPTTTIGRIAQGAGFLVIGALVWESKLKDGNGGST